MKRNFGTQQRDPMRAASVLLNASRGAGGTSFSTVATVLQRFDKFVSFARERGISRLDKVTQLLVQNYAAFLRDSDYTAAYQQNLLSAVNTVLARGYESQGQRWQPVTSRAEGLTRRDNVRKSPTTSKEQLQQAQADMPELAAAVAGLARELGLRSKEASLLNATAVLKEAKEKLLVTIVDGTKGGRPRTVPVTQPSQLDALINATRLQGDNRSLIPRHQTWVEFRASTLYNGRAALKRSGIKSYHDLRAAYAADRYLEETGCLAPCNNNGRRTAERTIDLKAREMIADELGHGRTDVLVSYVGSRKS
ncbi:MAG: hypothetical protein GX673_12530 [Gammaproteobacteria bacterium]|nr:hypothetical protein [Gammaproteobacteria bacterium]